MVAWQRVGGVLLAVAVVGGVVAYQAQETTAEHDAGEACRLFRRVQVEALSREVKPEAMVRVPAVLSNAAGAGADAARGDERFRPLATALTRFYDGSANWYGARFTATGGIAPEDVPLAERGYGVMEVTLPDVVVACDDAPFHPNDDL